MRKETGNPEIKPFCDFCDKCIPHPTNCFFCHKDVCWDCEKIHGTSLKYSHIFSNQIFVCNECLSTHSNSSILKAIYSLKASLLAREFYLEQEKKKLEHLSNNIEHMIKEHQRHELMGSVCEAISEIKSKARD